MNSNIVDKGYSMIDLLQWLIHNVEYKRYKLTYDIHPSFNFNGPGIRLAGDGRIICREQSYIGRYSSIGSYKPSKVIIGKGCRIGHFVQLFTSGLVADQDFAMRKDKLSYEKGDIIIGDYCWLGSQVVVTQNVRIGENTVIGANSTVTSDIPPNSIAVGAPARVVKLKSS